MHGQPPLHSHIGGTKHLNKPTAPELVEHLGGGRAQIEVLILGAGGIFFVEALAISALNVITKSAAEDMGASAKARSLLTTLAFVGLCIGVTSGGMLADVFGRRLCIIWSYCATVLATCLATMHQESWLLLCVIGGCIGFGTGLGMPASIVMLSEISPQRWRIPMRVATSIMFNLGVNYMPLLAALDDPSLQGLKWRDLLWYSAGPMALIGIMATVFLPESPIFQAAKGEHSAALKGFRWIAIRNGKDHDIDFEGPTARASSFTGPDLQEKLSIVFSKKYAFTTFAATYAAFCFNLTQYGALYANPQIFQRTSTIPPAWQMILSGLPGFVVLLFASTLLDKVSRKSACVAALSLLSLGLMWVCVSGIHPPPRSRFFESVFQMGAGAVTGGAAVGFTVIYQLSVEIYPTIAAGTGSAVVMGVGRIGAIIAPALFEHIQAVLDWPDFYYLLAGLSAFGMVFLLLMPSTEELQIDGLGDAEVGNMVVKLHSQNYGTTESVKVA